MKITFFEYTYQGGRKNNQDFYAHYIDDKGCCFVVADGLGGHLYGEVASKVFCETLIEQVPLFSRIILHENMNGLQSLILSAHQEMSKQILNEYGFIDCHTTFALAWIDENQFITAHVGDSRVYRISQQGIWRTADHTAVQALYEQGKVSEDDFARHPLQNQLLRTVNLYTPPEAEFSLQEPLTSKDTILLCSDGFWNAQSKAEIAKLALNSNVDEKIQARVASILRDNPHSDNITIQLIQVPAN